MASISFQKKKFEYNNVLRPLEVKDKFNNNKFYKYHGETFQFYTHSATIALDIYP